MTNHVPSRSDVYRRVAEQLDSESLFQFGCYLALLARDIDRGRLDAAKANVEELRAAIREREGDRCLPP